jgi:hypothetical protein
LLGDADPADIEAALRIFDEFAGKKVVGRVRFEASASISGAPW